MHLEWSLFVADADTITREVQCIDTVPFIDV